MAIGTRVGGGSLSGGSPISPGFLSYLDESTGLLPSQLQIQPNTQGMDLLRTQTLDPTRVSPWTQVQMDGQKLKSRANMDQAQRQHSPGSSRFSGAFNRLNMAPSKVMGQDMDINRNLMMQAEQRRQGQLMQMPGMELDQLAPQEFNINNALSEKQAQDVAIQSDWAEKMKGWAANQQSRAMIASGGGGKK